MAVDYTTTGLIAGVKRKATVPTNQNLFQDADFAKVLTDEMIDTIVPRMMSVREDYFVVNKDTLIVDGTKTYAVPQRAIGAKLKDALIVDANGDAVQDLPRVGYDDQSYYSVSDYAKPYGFFMQGHNLVLYPNEDAWVGKYLRMWYFRRPNQLVLTTDCGKITAINTGTRVVTLDSVPTSWAITNTFDVIAGRPNFDAVGEDQTITSIVGFDLTFTELPTGIQVGDYVALAGESPVAQIPFDAYGWLAQLGALKCIVGIANQTEMEMQLSVAQDLEMRFINKITPRVDEAPKRVISRRGIFRSGGVSWPR